jgi:hypothetical protein
MSVTATIFETMSEIDTKFAKLADREYDGITGEVKKWFKKLAVSSPLYGNLFASLFLISPHQLRSKCTERGKDT